MRLRLGLGLGLGLGVRLRLRLRGRCRRLCFRWRLRQCRRRGYPGEICSRLPIVRGSSAHRTHRVRCVQRVLRLCRDNHAQLTYGHPVPIRAGNIFQRRPSRILVSRPKPVDRQHNRDAVTIYESLNPPDPYPSPWPQVYIPAEFFYPAPPDTKRPSCPAGPRGSPGLTISIIPTAIGGSRTLTGRTV